MPTYGYICENCGHEFEQFQTITSKPLRKCLRCGKRTLKRLIGTGAGVIFKGSGFYATDYRSESYKKAAESEKGTTSKSADKKQPSAESKESKYNEKSKSDPKEKKKSA